MGRADRPDGGPDREAMATACGPRALGAPARRPGTDTAERDAQSPILHAPSAISTCEGDFGDACRHFGLDRLLFNVTNRGVLDELEGSSVQLNTLFFPIVGLVAFIVALQLAILARWR